MSTNPRVHTITIYSIDGAPKPSCDVLYVKRGDSIKWESGMDGVDFEINFESEKAIGARMDQTHARENQPATNPHKAIGKFGRYKYSIRELPDGEPLDPSIDIGDPGP